MRDPDLLRRILQPCIVRLVGVGENLVQIRDESWCDCGANGLDRIGFGKAQMGYDMGQDTRLCLCAAWPHHNLHNNSVYHNPPSPPTLPFHTRKRNVRLYGLRGTLGVVCAKEMKPSSSPLWECVPTGPAFDLYTRTGAGLEKTSEGHHLLVTKSKALDAGEEMCLEAGELRTLAVTANEMAAWLEVEEVASSSGTASEILYCEPGSEPERPGVFWRSMSPGRLLRGIEHVFECDLGPTFPSSFWPRGFPPPPEGGRGVNA